MTPCRILQVSLKNNKNARPPCLPPVQEEQLATSREELGDLLVTVPGTQSARRKLK